MSEEKMNDEDVVISFTAKEFNNATNNTIIVQLEALVDCITEAFVPVKGPSQDRSKHCYDGRLARAAAFSRIQKIAKQGEEYWTKKANKCETCAKRELCDKAHEGKLTGDDIKNVIVGALKKAFGDKFDIDVEKEDK